MNKQQTALEKLISEKYKIKERCQLQELKLNEDFNDIRDNATTLLLSGFTSLLFPKTKPTSSGTQQLGVHSENRATSSLGLSDIISLGKGLLPVILDVSKPLLLTWGIKKAGALILSLFLRKKK